MIAIVYCYLRLGGQDDRSWHVGDSYPSGFEQFDWVCRYMSTLLRNLPHTINLMVLNFEVRSLLYIHLYIYCIIYIYMYMYLYDVSANLDKCFACEAGTFEEGCAPGHGDAC
jgi:hypothetical protein